MKFVTVLLENEITGDQAYNMMDLNNEDKIGSKDIAKFIASLDCLFH